MSLKDAIREAVDERHKQEGNLAQTTAQPQTAEPQQANKPRATTEPESKAVNTVRHKAVFTASSKAVMNAEGSALSPARGEGEGEDSVELAAMTVRVPRQHRIHWLISAKKEGTSLTAAITEALNARFGEPVEREG